jgi:hypothetical protein
MILPPQIYKQLFLINKIHINPAINFYPNKDGEDFLSLIIDGREVHTFFLMLGQLVFLNDVTNFFNLILLNNLQQ